MSISDLKKVISLDLPMKIKSNYHGEFDIILKDDKSNNYLDIPDGRELVYNDNSYTFIVFDVSNIPTKFYINDEIYDIELCNNDTDIYEFKLINHSNENCNKPFLNSFGAIRIEIEINDKHYFSKNISVMVSNTNINKSVINMVQYIYENCENYLYEEHKFSAQSSGIKPSEIKSFEAKIAFLQKALNVYKNSYRYFKINPYTKLKKIEKVDTFDRLHMISSKTIRYISNHIEELSLVNYNTGIKYNKYYYQPNKVLIEHNLYSFDVYENHIVVGFLKTIIHDIIKMIKELQEYRYPKNIVADKDGYIDSTYQIFSRSIKKINNYIEDLESLKLEYQQIFNYYSKIFNIEVESIKKLPTFTPVFRSVNSYRQIYGIIHDWFSIGNCDLGKEELILSFISTSRIYEYYCLVKILRYFESNFEMNLINKFSFSYLVSDSYYSNTKYNNTFEFSDDNKRVIIYFQPVIYGDAFSINANGIKLFRNTSMSIRKEINKKGYVYTPDYMIKVEYENKTNYIIMDAKFSTPDNIKKYQMQELIFKYLFSISTVNEEDNILGLYIICGKTAEIDHRNIIHDLAKKINYPVQPYAEILLMNGIDTENYEIPAVIFSNIN